MGIVKIKDIKNVDEFETKSTEVKAWLKKVHKLKEGRDYHVWHESATRTLSFKFYGKHDYGTTPKGFEEFFALMWC